MQGQQHVRVARICGKAFRASHQSDEFGGTYVVYIVECKRCFETANNGCSRMPHEMWKIVVGGRGVSGCWAVMAEFDKVMINLSLGNELLKTHDRSSMAGSQPGSHALTLCPVIDWGSRDRWSTGLHFCACNGTIHFFALTQVQSDKFLERVGRVQDT